MINDNSSNPHGFTPDDFAPTGVINLSPEALSDARAFLIHLGQFDGSARWIAGFVWTYARSMRKSGQTEIVDEGPGIDLAGYRFSEIPSYAVESRDGTPVIFIIPQDKIAAATQKEIVEVKLVTGRPSFELI
jgi:hypothetical protein